MSMAVVVVVVVVTSRPMDMWVVRIRWAMTMVMVVTTPVLAISTVFWLETFTHLVDDEVHGTQHLGQHVVGFNFQVIGLQLNGHMAVA